jgi:hypothetical protein
MYKSIRNNVFLKNVFHKIMQYDLFSCMLTTKPADRHLKLNDTVCFEYLISMLKINFVLETADALMHAVQLCN